MSNYPDGCNGPPDDSLSTLQELLAELARDDVLLKASTAAELAQDLCEVAVSRPAAEDVDDDEETHQWDFLTVLPIVSGDESREAVLASVATALRAASDSILEQLAAEQAAREARRRPACPQTEGTLPCLTNVTH